MTAPQTNRIRENINNICDFMAESLSRQIIPVVYAPPETAEEKKKAKVMKKLLKYYFKKLS